jgi:hypothetical protein
LWGFSRHAALCKRGLPFFIATTTAALARWLAFVAWRFVATTPATHAAFATLVVRRPIAIAVQDWGRLLQSSGLCALC